MESVKPLVRRFAAPVVAAYLLHWGVWMLLLVAEQVVMAGLTQSVNWVATEFFGKFAFIEEWTVSTHFLPIQVSEGVIPIAAGLLVGYWTMCRKNFAAGTAAHN
jgi:hypothetical protein